MFWKNRLGICPYGVFTYGVQYHPCGEILYSESLFRDATGYFSNGFRYYPCHRCGAGGISKIVTRKSQHRVEVSEFHRWAGSFSEDFLRVLAKNISMLLPEDRVAAYPWTDRFSPTFRIPLTVEQFDGRFGEHVVLNVTWSVWNQKDANDPVMKHTRIKEPVSASDYDALVAAQSRAIGTLSRAIVDEIERVSHRDRGFSGSKN